MPSAAKSTGNTQWTDARTVAVAAVALVALTGVSLWTYRVAERLTLPRARERVEFALNAQVAALDAWLDGEASLLSRIAAEPDVRMQLLALLSRTRSKSLTIPQLLGVPEAQQLNAALAPILATHNFENFAVLDSGRRIVASSEPTLVGLQSTVYSAATVQQLNERGAAIVPPFLLPESSTGRLRPVLLAAVAVREDRNRPVIGWLDVRLNSRARFEPLLSAGRFGSTGETFAFSRDAMLLSPSRFEEVLRRAGMLPADPTAPATLRLGNPGADLSAGERSSTPPDQWALTRMAAAAIQGVDGVDVEGYHSYLGRKVVGAWRWLPRYELGVAAEQGYDETFSGLRIVWQAFLVLLALLGLGTLGLLGASRLLARAEGRARRAERLGQYVLERRIADGAMGTVWRARHALLRRPTAIKVLAPGRSSSRALARFEREALLTSQLTHPNTIAVFDFGHTPDGTFYLAMEYLVGLSLEELVQRHGPVPERRVVYILKQVLGSLAEAHAIGLVHRDIKPANVMICHRGGIPDFAKVLDFGLVKDRDDQDPKITTDGAAVGTPLYMAPEASSHGGEVDGRSDLYSLGCVAWYLLVGEPPFPGQVARQVMRRHVEEALPPLSERAPFPVHPSLEAAILRCLAKEPRHRPATASALADLLTNVIEPELGPWTTEEAELWWREHEPGRIGVVTEAPVTVPGSCLTVDLGGRGTLQQS